MRDIPSIQRQEEMRLARGIWILVILVTTGQEAAASGRNINIQPE